MTHSYTFLLITTPRRSLLLFLTLLLAGLNAQAQTTWTGTTNREMGANGCKRTVQAVLQEQ